MCCPSKKNGCWRYQVILRHSTDLRTRLPRSLMAIDAYPVYLDHGSIHGGLLLINGYTTCVTSCKKFHKGWLVDNPLPLGPVTAPFCCGNAHVRGRRSCGGTCTTQWEKCAVIYFTRWFYGTHTGIQCLRCNSWAWVLWLWIKNKTKTSSQFKCNVKCLSVVYCLCVLISCKINDG